MSGTMSANSLVCLTCPAITAWVTPASFSRLMQVPSWPSETQWMRRAGGRAAAASRSGKASSLSAMTVTSWPAPRAASRTRNGNRPLPAIRPSVVDGPASGRLLDRPSTFLGAPRSARRRMTPRCDERMKSTRYCTSAQASDRSCSICCSALRRVQLRLQQVAERALQLRDRRPARSRGASGRWCWRRRSAPDGCRRCARTAARPW